MADCWYRRIADGIATLGEPLAFDCRAELGAQGWAGTGRRLGSAQTAPAQGDDRVRAGMQSVRTEPPPWYYPVRQSLGAVLLQAGRAADAEQVYREDLRRNPGNGWSLYGLAQSLRAQGKTGEAAQTDESFKKAWAQADVQLTASRF